ncbi:MAG TPA: ABC transporter permease [Gemmatimonadaceae bacterium]|nr:ABC transporter permease [Gemmatimonadaceae bacterium]
MSATTAVDFLDAAIRSATPLLLAALGETVSERSGVINVGLEGTIIVGCLAGLVASNALGPEAGLLAAGAAGVLIALVFAVVAIGLVADQIITGTAITMLGLGLTSTMYRVIYGDGGAALSTPTLSPLAIPGLSSIPLIGDLLFRQPLPTYLGVLLVPTVWWWLYRTQSGLALRAVGENPDAARASGLSPRRLQVVAVLFGGMCGGLAGGTLVLAQVGTFAEGMSAGRGFIAIAIVALGRWHPVGGAMGALLFGMASALQFLFQALDLNVPYQIFLALPYFLTLLALMLASGRYRAPAALAMRPNSAF